MARAEWRKPLKTLAERYGKRLESISAERQAAGNLEGVLAVSNEIKHLKEKGDTNPKPPDGEAGDLVSSRRIFLREKEALERMIARQTEPMDRAFRENLDRIGKEYTAEGDILA